MSIRFVESGGQYHLNSGVGVAGVWGSASSNGIVSNAIARNGSTYAYGQNSNLKTPNLGGGSGYNGMVAGFALYSPTITNNQQLIVFLDNSNANQCDVRMNGSGQLFFTRNGTTIGSTSTSVLTANTWSYIEFKASFSITGTGSCEVRVNGIVFVSSSSLTNATTTAKGFGVQFATENAANAAAMDFYVLDTDSSSGGGSNPNNTYLGDITVAEIYPNGAGVHSDWSQATNNGGAGSPPPFALSSCNNTSGGTTVYNRTTTATGEATNAYQGYYFIVSGFVTHSAQNNGTFLCDLSSTTTITLSNPNGIAETVSASAAFQAITQCGIHGGIVDGYQLGAVGTRNNGDATFILDSSSGDINDFAHQTLPGIGTIYGVVHVSLARDDAGGGATMNQVCISNATTETSTAISLGASYQYYQDIIELDPHTSATWTGSNYNAATFGPKKT
jgi:hypothetical protein